MFLIGYQSRNSFRKCALAQNNRNKMLPNLNFLTKYSKRKLLYYVLLYFISIFELPSRFRSYDTGIKIKYAEFAGGSFLIQSTMNARIDII